MSDQAGQSPASFYSSPQEALQAPREELVYVACLHVGTGVDKPDFLAVVDVNPDSDEYGRIVHETPMPNTGDELHHYGWNRCSSACHGPDRSHLIVPGFGSSRIHVLNVADDPRQPRIEKVIEPEELVRETGYTRPHTVHCMPGDNVVVSMLGDADGGGAGGFAVLDARTFELKGRWEDGGETPPMNYDFWYQPRKDTLISSEFGEPNAYEPGFDIDDVAAGRYGQRLHFWSISGRRLEQTVDLGEAGLVPLEIRWLHDPDAEQGFVGATLASNIIRFSRDNGSWGAETIVDVESVELEGWPLPGGGPGSHHRHRALDGRSLPLHVELAPWRSAPVRRLGPPPAEAHGAALARRPAGQAERRGPRPERRASDDPALARRASPVRHELALLELGQPVLSGAALLAPEGELPSGGRDGCRPRLLRRFPRACRWAGARPRGAPARGRLHDRDLPVMLMAHQLGDGVGAWLSHFDATSSPAA
jgi:hypothetical protein